MPTLPGSLPEWATSSGSSIIGSLNVNNITYLGQTTSGFITRYTFSGSPDLSSVLPGYYLTVTGADESENNGTYKIKEVNNTSDYIDVFNNSRQDASLDETGSPGTGEVTDIGTVITEPSQAKKEQGWLAPFPPSDGTLNWYMNLAYQWIKYGSEGGFAELQNYASITALKAIETDDILDRSKHLVDQGWIYEYDASSTLTGDNEFILLPDSGTGRFIAIIPTIDAMLAMVDPKINELQGQIDVLMTEIDSLKTRVTALGG